MGELIHLFGTEKKPGDNLITSAPFEFRKADWDTIHFIQVRRSHADEFERARLEARREGAATSDRIPLPSHVELTGGLFNTILGLFGCRDNEGTMREVYYLAGLTDCMINQVNPVLRTDLLRDMYRRIFKMKERLRIAWYGRPFDRVLLPIDPALFNEAIYRTNITLAGSMKELYTVIRKGTEEMFDILAGNYSFYCPSGSAFPRRQP